jgi:putative ABC transport system permease protein
MSTQGISFSPLVVGSLATALLVAMALLIAGKVPISYNLRNLTVRWITTTLTAVAFTLVIALLTVMLAFVNGMYRLTQNSGQPGNVIIMSEGSTDESFSNLRFSDTGDIKTQPGILQENGEALCSGETYVVVNQPLQNPVPGRPKRRLTQVRGIEDPRIAGRVHGLRLVEGGQWFSEAGVREAANPNDPPLIEAVLGAGLARVLSQDRNSEELASAKNPDRMEVGDVFPLRDRQWVVVGVLEQSGSTFDSEVWAKRSIVGPMFGKETFSSFVVRTEGAASAVKKPTTSPVFPERTDSSWSRSYSWRP